WYDLEIGSLSGGEKKLVNLARILIKAPDLLLLDEPDNHLDLEAKAWLEQYISSYPGTVLIISHDRQLLDRAVKKIFELEDGKIKVNLDADRSGKKVLEVQGLSKSYDGYVLFQPFDFTILYGERVGIVGTNGSGKTTLLKTMMEMLPADSGSVKIGASVVVGY